MSTLGQKPATQHVSTEKQSITGNGGTSYTLQQSVSQASDIEVFVNNTRQEPTAAYTANGTTLTMTGAVNSSDSFYVIFQGKAIQTAGLPVDAAITASAITASQTITSTGNITTSGTVNTPSINGGQIGGRRNIIINGAMKVSQRGTSFTSQTADHYFIDRFKLGATSLGTWTTSQSTDSPNGFAYSAKIECTTADASPASTDLLYFYSRLEGQDLQQLKFGTSDAESVSISFYVKCSKTGVFTVNWRNQDAGRSIGSDVTISSADTWEYKTITFVGDTSGAFNNDNGWSANLEFILNAGTNYTSGNTLTSYASHSNTNGTRSGGTTLALGANTGETIQFTGVQLEVGSQATPFEHRSFGEELALCQRYYYRVQGSAEANIATGNAWDARSADYTIPLPTRMRAAYTLSVSALTDIIFKYGARSERTDGQYFQLTNSTSLDFASINHQILTNSTTVGFATHLALKDADSYFELTAEL